MALLSRRNFLIGGAVLGGTAAAGLIVGTGYLASLDTDGLHGIVDEKGRAHLNAWITVAVDGSIEIAVPRAEMGQGIHTGIATLICEELEIALSDPRVSIVHPKEELPAYGNYTLVLNKRPEDRSGLALWFGKKFLATFPYIGTGGSVSIQDAWVPARIAGASARIMLTEAAARRWVVPASECRAENGVIVHQPTRRSLTYGALAIDAAEIAPPSQPVLKPASAFRQIGKPLLRKDIPAKVTGAATFGIDVILPDMLYAALALPPALGAKVTAVNKDAAKAVSGVVDCISFDDTVAVIASSWWTASQALERAAVQFDDGPHANLSSDALARSLKAALDGGPAKVVEEAGQIMPARQSTPLELRSADYETPLVTHACLEPLSATARYQNGVLELWGSSQSPLVMRWGAERGAKLTGAVPEKIVNHVTLAGGAFGRRSEAVDYIIPAALACKLPGRAIKTIWTRQQDMANGRYRSGSAIRVAAALDNTGVPTEWRSRVASGSLGYSFGERNLPFGGDDPTKDHFAYEGATDLLYFIPYRQTEFAYLASPIPLGFWRSNGFSNTVFAVESFIDECARAARQDPLEYRLRLIGEETPAGKVLITLRDQSGWRLPKSAGTGRGLAIGQSYNSIVAQAVDVTVSGDRALKINRVVTVIDCGPVINPNTIMAQMEGSAIWSLTTALYSQITLSKGQVEQRSYSDYPVMSLAETPAFETHILSNLEKPGGVGEPAVSPITAALTNAIADATGVRIRKLPLLNNQNRFTA